jgi:hypothetical protein
MNSSNQETTDPIFGHVITEIYVFTRRNWLIVLSLEALVTGMAAKLSSSVRVFVNAGWLLQQARASFTVDRGGLILL